MKMASLHHEKSKIYNQLAIFMSRGAPPAHDACCKIPITLIFAATANYLFPD